MTVRRSGSNVDARARICSSCDFVPNRRFGYLGSSALSQFSGMPLAVSAQGARPALYLGVGHRAVPVQAATETTLTTRVPIRQDADIPKSGN